MVMQRGVMLYTTPVDTPSQDAATLLMLATGQVAGGVVLAGNAIAVTLPPYAKKDLGYVDDAVITRTKGGIIQGRFFGTENRHRISTDIVAYQHATGGSNDYLALLHLNNAMAQKITAQWWPDYTNFPAESVFVMMDKREPPKRRATTNFFTFDFDLIEIANVQLPSTLPTFTTIQYTRADAGGNTRIDAFGNIRVTA